MIFSPSEILPVAESTGFRADVIEKGRNRAVIVNNRCRRAGPHYAEPDVALEGYERS